ncbi:MAG: VTT domain-containing protein [Patescibacteria group bacterium]|nr:VTT domain-containing protein [Patescibacteria group bacterium]
MEQLKFWLDPVKIIETFGYAGIAFIIFAESGLLFGFFFPGDSLLFTAGLLASKGFLNIILVSAISFVAAVAGDNVGYSFGKKVGPRIFNRDKSFLFDKEHLLKAEKFYEKHGAKTIILARFMPFIRTFAPIVAGVGRMNYSVFFTYNIIGGFVWSLGVPFLGFFLGKSIPNIDRYLLPIIGLIVVLSVAPGIVHLLRERLLTLKS